MRPILLVCIGVILLAVGYFLGGQADRPTSMSQEGSALPDTGENRSDEPGDSPAGAASAPSVVDDNTIDRETRFSFTSEIDLDLASDGEWIDEYGCSENQVLEATQTSYQSMGPLANVESGCEFSQFAASSLEEAKWMQRHLYPHLSVLENLDALDVALLTEEALNGNAEAAIAMSFSHRSQGELEAAVELADLAARTAPDSVFPHNLLADASILQGDALYNEYLSLEPTNPFRESLLAEATAHYIAALRSFNAAIQMGDHSAYSSRSQFLSDRQFDPAFNFAELALLGSQANFDAVIGQNGGCLPLSWASPDVRPPDP